MTIHITDDELVLIVCAANDWAENAERWRDSDQGVADESDRNAATLRSLLERFSLHGETWAIGEKPANPTLTNHIPDAGKMVPTLTDEERAAIAGAIAAEHGRGAWAWAATLRSLLERQQDTPAAHATPREGSEQDGCTLADAEREAIESAIWDYQQNDDDKDCALLVCTLEGLLERMA